MTNSADVEFGPNNVAGALLAGGYDLKDLYARPGLALTCEINGKIYSIPGEEGKPGKILLNERLVEFSEEIKHEDRIRFFSGQKGQEAKITFGELLKEQIGICYINGQEVELLPVIRVEDQIVSRHDWVVDGCKIEMESSYTIEEVLQKAGLTTGEEHVSINGREVNLLEMAKITKNGEIVSYKEQVYPGDDLAFVKLSEVYIKDIIRDEPLTHIEVS